MKSGKTVSVVTKWREAYVVTWRSWIRADGGTNLSVWAVSVTRHFGQTMKSCRNLTLMQSWAVWFKAHSLHHLTVGYQRSRHSTQNALPVRFAIATNAVCKVFYSA